MLRILLVEDDNLLGDGIHEGLTQFGYNVEWVQDGAIALHALKVEPFDLVVLDLGLPKKSGIEVLRSMRRSNINIPVIILTARDSIDDRVQGLDAGADDYMIKPFDLNELCARIRAASRRNASHGKPDNLLSVGAVELDTASLSVAAEGQNIPVSRREFAILHKLMANTNRVMSRQSLTESVYGWDDEIDSNAIEVHIHNLRKKLAEYLKIRTIRGIGYIIEQNHP